MPSYIAKCSNSYTKIHRNYVKQIRYGSLTAKSLIEAKIKFKARFRKCKCGGSWIDIERLFV